MRWDWTVKIKLMIVLGGTIALFVGLDFWTGTIQRNDPRGPFIFLNLSDRLPAVALLAGMLAACAVVAELLLHNDLPHVGWLAVAAGWLGIALRSPAIGQHLMYISDGETVHYFYRWLLLELFVLSGLSMLACALASWVVQSLARRKAPGNAQAPPDAANEAAGPAALPAARAADKFTKSGAGRRRQPPAKAARADKPEGDSVMDLAANFTGASALGILLYIRLLDHSPVRGQISGDILRGQVLFALSAGFFLAAFASHQVMPTRGPWGLLLSVLVTAAGCYLFSLFDTGERRFDFQAPVRAGWPLPVDFLGLGLASVMAAYLISLRLIQVRRDNQKAQAQGGGTG